MEAQRDQVSIRMGYDVLLIPTASRWRIEEDHGCHEYVDQYGLNASYLR